ncbi:DNA polymerase IV [Aestuariibacter sp. AA17]|uniref:DNA polymerase IV n=1 Tax=Fluctibacter corallii TaxID=2984329 RepID=A0ABT3A7J1_9ALTE|nr:DNA polymerase IV [Aestuariibacter sp. AA17]MCV2884661.1 DNA polymerase IV [Aestuariibacter sp. AA17]
MKKIIHVDMDCFYAAVEMRDNPALTHKPIAIGGSAERRGVISTCNYPARKYGVRSAMATAHALKLCPDLVLVPGRMDVYVSVSKQIREIFSRYTSIIEPLSLDEAYLDVTHSTLFQGSATLIAEDIRRTIFDETGLTASAGVAPCKFVAKIASDENKPNGMCVVTPDDLDAFVKILPLGKIPGVGKVTVEKLHTMGLYTCEDVRAYSLPELIKRFGKFGPVLWNRSHGIDNRDVKVERQRKSVGVERTLSEDIASLDDCLNMVEHLYPKLVERLDNANTSGRIASQGVKLKFSDFQQTTVEHRHQTLDKAYFHTLIEEAFSRKGEGRGIRLVGLHVGLPDASKQHQYSFTF